MHVSVCCAGGNVHPKCEVPLQVRHSLMLYTVCDVCICNALIYDRYVYKGPDMIVYALREKRQREAEEKKAPVLRDEIEEYEAARYIGQTYPKKISSCT